MTDDSAHLRDELRIFKGVANELGGIVQGVVDALGIRRDAGRDVVLAELGRRLLPAEQHPVPAGGSAPAAELEQLKWERDMALSRVAAAEAVEGRMADSLPDSGPWESWSERDRAVRDYEGDLAAALAIETDIVAERLREVERERDEARAEVERMRLVVEAAAAYVDSTAEPTDTPHEDTLLDAVAAYRAGGSAPHQGATTDEDEKFRQIAAATLRAEAAWWELVRPQSVWRTQFGTWLRGRADVWAAGEGHGQAEVRALLGAGETTEAGQ